MAATLDVSVNTCLHPTAIMHRHDCSYIRRAVHTVVEFVAVAGGDGQRQPLLQHPAALRLQGGQLGGRQALI